MESATGRPSYLTPALRFDYDVARQYYPEILGVFQSLIICVILDFPCFWKIYACFSGRAVSFLFCSSPRSLSAVCRHRSRQPGRISKRGLRHQWSGDGGGSGKIALGLGQRVRLIGWLDVRAKRGGRLRQPGEWHQQFRPGSWYGVLDVRCTGHCVDRWNVQQSGHAGRRRQLRIGNKRCWFGCRKCESAFG